MMMGKLQFGKRAEIFVMTCQSRPWVEVARMYEERQEWGGVDAKQIREKVGDGCSDWVGSKSWQKRQHPG